MDDRRYAYYAFISYSHKDERWAKWLQRKLENYRLPSAIRKESDGRIPKHIRPVFRDRTDIGVGQTVRQNLRQELADSRYLIVVCSPDGAQSDFVDMEIRNFQEMGRADRIIPFIVRGTPDPKDGAKQCYPPSLLQGKDTMLGASLEELSPNEALVKVVAAILGLRYDHLWQRHKRRERLWRIGVAVAACLLLVVGYGAVDYYFVTHIRYYDDYVDRWGVPEGIARLTQEQVSHRAMSWRLETLRGKPRRLTRVDASGNARPVAYNDEQDRPDDQRFYYGENGRIAYVDDYSSTSQFVKRREYTQNLEYVRFYLGSGLETKTLVRTKVVLEGEGALSYSKKQSEISALHCQYDSSGCLTRVEYRNLSGSVRPDANGVFGQRYRYNAAGRIESTVNLDGNKEALAVRGVVEKRFRYTAEGYQSRIEYLDARGELVLSPERVAVIAFEVDVWGNRVQTTFFDKDGNRCLHKDGYAQLIRENDEKGNATKLTYLDAEGKRCYSMHKVSSVKLSYDGNGRLSRAAYFDKNDQPCYNIAGCAMTEKDYDAHGNTVYEACHGVDGKPCVSAEGFFLMKFSYDASGNLITKSYFGVNGTPCMVGDGYSIEEHAYDQKGDRIRVAYFDQAGQPCVIKKKYSVLLQDYDGQGKVIKETSLGVDGKPCPSEEGVATCETRYDMNGNEVEQKYYDANGDPCLREGRFATIQMRYDKNGNRIEESYLGLDGRLRERGDGIAVLQRAYDKFGNVKSITMYDAQLQPSQLNNGVMYLDIAYDTRGNMVKISCFDRDRRLRALPAGYAIIKKKFDARGNMTNISYFGPDGQPCYANTGFSSQEWTYDARGNKIKEAYFDTAGNPCLSQAGIAGWIDEYDMRDNKISHKTNGLADGQKAGVRMVRVGNVIDLGQAALNGIQKDDFLFEYCFWRWESDKELNRLQGAIDSCRTYRKRILTVSPTGQVHAFDADVGVVGMELQYVVVTDAQAAGLRAAYDRYTKARDN
ncbi:MAG: TIR domain-containing protein [Solidesulfovibrio sp. DCME]|uniref:toll/interleukin-1 receptor domain-containing protein n=1 Tax=Solidesulfovibrio sp. DCME TaxID=3447380 RepID=UPI003D13363C